MALISVLAVLLLLTLLVVAFVGRTTAARASSNLYHATASTRLLADTAVNLVQAQINEATTQGITMTATASGPATYTWASQPGAIRVFDQNGALNNVYRLYSATPATASNARKTTTLSDLASDLPPGSGWATAAAEWVDLNASVKDSEGKYHFPIIDPRDPGASQTANPTSVATLWQPASGAMALKGFSIQPPAAVGTSSPAPMPVQWLYVLKDGSIISPDLPGGTATTLTFKNASDVPTVKNPIVGRIAYWTDDDSSKININTAAGDDVVRSPNTYAADSIFWATPVFCAPDDAFLASYEPSNGEIQRYSGHPGSVGLNTTLSTLAGLSTPLSYSDFYSLTPRYAGGGSTSATVATPKNGGVASSVLLTANRLYTSVSEMLYNVNRSQSKLVTDSTSEAEAGAAVERANFFLTAHSSSSELNLFGEPRVSIWPMTQAHGAYTLAQSQTPLDRLIGFDSTLTTIAGPEDFYFQRIDPTSSITDCTIPSNTALFTYLDYLTSHPIPGFGDGSSISSNFTTNKYPNPAMRQILSEIFDYVRTTNMLDPTLLSGTTVNQTSSKTYGQSWGYNNLTPVTVQTTLNTTTGIVTTVGGNNGGGVQVVPSANGGKGVNNWGTQGLGSFPVPIEVTIDFVALGLGQEPAIPAVGTLPTLPAVPEVPIPYQQYKYPLLSHDTNVSEGPSLGYPANYPAIPLSDDIEDDTSANNALAPPTNPVSGKPADATTAMQAFVLVSFLNPAQVSSGIQPVFCFSIQPQTNLTVTGYTGTKTTTGSVTTTTGTATLPIPLFFPGNSANATGTGISNNKEEFSVVDNTDGAGFLNGWIGDWTFGYIPFYGETGIDNYGSNPALLGPNESGAIWSIKNNINLASGTTTGRWFPFYSQIFSLPGNQTWVVPPGAPNLNPNPANTFQFSGGTFKITMYDAHTYGQKLLSGTTMNPVSTYMVTFPAVGAPILAPPDPNNPSPPDSTPPPTMPLPICRATGTDVVGSTGPPVALAATGRIVGTLGNANEAYNYVTDDRWHYAVGISSGYQFYGVPIEINDTVESVVLSQAWSDARDLSANAVNVTPFMGHPNYGGNQAHDLLADSNQAFIGNLNPTNWGRLVQNAIYPSQFTLPVSSSWEYPHVPPELNGAYTTTGAPGDWDNGFGEQNDGPWVNMADMGALLTNVPAGQPQFISYFDEGNAGQKVGIQTTFSPNRMMPSPVMFGSLPTGVSATSPKPWQTLLFRPGAGAGGFGFFHPGERNQPGSGDPADHLLLDLFWMPQAEPYPISQPFVTEGKINLNYEIQPFTYITRNTALRALLAGEKIAVMPDAASQLYKNDVWGGAAPGVTTTQLAGFTGGMDAYGDSRLPIDVDQTLGLNPDPTQNPHAPASGTSSTETAQTGANAWYDNQANTTRFFKSPSELCEMFLVPKGYDWQEFSGATFNSHSWYKIPHGDFALVGDNTRERPYSDLYSRVTTKSNTYTVYYTVQSLKNAQPADDTSQQTWNESTGSVTGEYRGSTTLERYLDINATLPDCLGSPGQYSLEPYYKWRVVETRQFAP